MMIVKKAKAFAMGVREYGTDLTLHYEDESLMSAYDTGRHIARKAFWED